MILKNIADFIILTPFFVCAFLIGDSILYQKKYGNPADKAATEADKKAYDDV